MMDAAPIARRRCGFHLITSRAGGTPVGLRDSDFYWQAIAMSAATMTFTGLAGFSLVSKGGGVVTGGLTWAFYPSLVTKSAR
jgi:hypothetical protein